MTEHENVNRKILLVVVTIHGGGNHLLQEIATALGFYKLEDGNMEKDHLYTVQNTFPHCRVEVPERFKAKYLCCLRNPYSIYNSCSERYFDKFLVERIKEFYNYIKTVPADKIIKYENLCVNPRYHIGEIASWLGVNEADAINKTVKLVYKPSKLYPVAKKYIPEFGGIMQTYDYKVKRKTVFNMISAYVNHTIRDIGLLKDGLYSSRVSGSALVRHKYSLLSRIITKSNIFIRKKWLKIQKEHLWINISEKKKSKPLQ